jgi:hypothetical protein
MIQKPSNALRKLLLTLVLFFALSGFSQDSTRVKQRTPFKESDIIIDTSDTIQKSGFAPDFKSKYKSDEFDYEVKVPVKNAWDRFKEWLADFFRRLFNFSNPEASMNFVVILLKCLAVAIILLVIYLIVKSIMNKDGQWVFGKNSDRKIIRYEEIEKNLHRLDFEKLIKEAVSSGEKRLSIRYYYLWLLKRMSEKSIIQWDAEKTNSDYLYEIQNEKLKDSFRYLSYLYNYIWYGEFEIDEATFEKAADTFQKTIQSL